MFIPLTRRVAVVLLASIVWVSVLFTSSRLDWENSDLEPPRLLRNESLESSSAVDSGPQFAYAQYATSLNYLCNAIINFHRLDRFGTRHDMVLIFPESWSEGKTPEAKAIRKLRADHPRLVLRPFEYLRISKTKASATWADSLNKFHAFALTEYSRVLIFDSDTQVLNNMDHLFLVPRAPVAVPRAYWLNELEATAEEHVLSSHVMLIEPDTQLHDALVEESLSSGMLDMDLVNRRFKDTAMLLPHRRLALLTGEFRGGDHQRYLSPNRHEEWDPVAEASGAYMVHFSDWPMPKPWEPRTAEQWSAALPACEASEADRPGRPRCADRLVWTGFYEDYDRDRKMYCRRLG
ncbi:alphan-acetylglucosamine transferase [Colletotrichum musicola]|uniref:Alphan-acetylglucosamine transferase n=1 Tax=Colletotrichum musicola TaxID=2175873 RepID=A0A8H6KE68_9PEZI|nr:alphan-acetylglucosamine transferase [Colletotrichum musicola]